MRLSLPLLSQKPVLFGDSKPPESKPACQKPGENAGDSVCLNCANRQPVKAAPIPTPSEAHFINNPFAAKVVSVESQDPTTNDPKQAYSFKVVLDVTGSDFVKDGKLQLKPGHHVGVYKPGRDRPRWYSVGKTFTDNGKAQVQLLVRRSEFEENGQTVKGLTSNFMSTMTSGQKVNIIGGRTHRFLMPPNPDANLLLFSVGVAVSPYVGFLQDRLEGKSDGQKRGLGETRLYTGYKKQNDELCGPEIKQYAADAKNKLHYESAFSREAGQNASDPKRVNDLVERDADAIIRLLKDEKTRVYICGVNGLEDAILQAVVRKAKEKGEDVPALVDQINKMKQTGRWQVEWGR